jgi:hypothetical protein
VTSSLIGICERLECCDKLPHDIEKIILSILDTCTVLRFTTHFSTLYTMQSSILSNYKTILVEATRLYRELRTGPRNFWLPTTKTGSIYFTTSTPCASPSTVSTTTPTTLPTHDKKGNVIDRTPPPTGTSPSRIGPNNNTEHWCSKCSRWGNHLTETHEDWRKKIKDRRKKSSTGGSNAAVVSSTPTSSTSTSANSSPASTQSISSGTLVSTPSTTSTTHGVHSASVTRILRADFD